MKNPKRTIDYYMNLDYRMEIVRDADEGGYVISFPELPGCLTAGATIEKAVKSAEDAKKAWLKVALDEGIDIREPLLP